MAGGPGVVGEFCFLTVVRTYPVVGKARRRPRILNQSSYRGQKWASTELVNIYPTYPEKPDFCKQTPKVLPISLLSESRPNRRTLLTLAKSQRTFSRLQHAGNNGHFGSIRIIGNDCSLPFSNLFVRKGGKKGEVRTSRQYCASYVLACR